MQIVQLGNITKCKECKEKCSEKLVETTIIIGKCKNANNVR